jgi:hypothetical protein
MRVNDFIDDFSDGPDINPQADPDKTETLELNWYD